MIYCLLLFTYYIGTSFLVQSAKKRKEKQDLYDEYLNVYQEYPFTFDLVSNPGIDCRIKKLKE